jgi:MFS transporter, YNFM family, putative membrane transport protein
LAPSLILIIAGLALSAACGLICQAISTGYVTTTAKAGRSSAVGLYVTSFYAGGSSGAALGGIAWTLGAWPACVAQVVVTLLLMAAVVYFAWSRSAPPPQAALTELVRAETEE